MRTGPDVLSTVGVGSGYGAKSVTHYIGELWLGNKTVVLAVANGLAAAMPAVPAVRTVVRPGSVPFLSGSANRVYR